MHAYITYMHTCMHPSQARFGLRSDYVCASLKSDAFNHATASYALVEEQAAAEDEARGGAV